MAADGIEVARRTCGGHGYSALSGLPRLFASYVQNVTWEGDNNVLYLQVCGDGGVVYVWQQYTSSVDMRTCLPPSPYTLSLTPVLFASLQLIVVLLVPFSRLHA